MLQAMDIKHQHCVCFFFMLRPQPELQPSQHICFFEFMSLYIMCSTHLKWPHIACMFNLCTSTHNAPKWWVCLLNLLQCPTSNCRLALTFDRNTYQLWSQCPRAAKPAKQTYHVLADLYKVTVILVRNESADLNLTFTIWNDIIARWMNQLRVI